MTGTTEASRPGTGDRPENDLERLERVLGALGPVAVAVSGGVDSMTLAHVTARVAGAGAEMVHAVSPAVPPAATARVRAHARRGGWRLSVIDAREFADARYMENPANRCYFCKTNLYGTIAARTAARILSGTNLDDLADFRPGLAAAEEHGVRHPYVEAEIAKAGVRRIAAGLGLDDVAELPAAPCLSSRVETGIAIDPRVLRAVDRAERLLTDALSPRTVRCRMRRSRVVVELDSATLEGLDADARTALGASVGRLFAAAGVRHPVAFAAYRMGSAFLRPPSGG